MGNELTNLQENGIQIDSENRSPSELISAGYSRIGTETTARQQFDVATKAISSWMMDQNYTRDTYKVLLKEGYRLGQSFTGADFSANQFSKVEGNLGGPVGLNKVSDHFNPATLINGVFTVMSIATSQYFMAQINNKLGEIQDGINEVRQFLEDDKLSELQAGYDELRELYDHLPYIKGSKERTYLNLERIRHIMHIARKDMRFFARHIESIKNTAGNRDKRELAKENARKIVEALSRYRLALALFCETKLIELFLSNVNEPDEMDLFKQEMEDHVNVFIETYTGSKEWCRRYYLTHNLVEESGNLPFIDSIDAFLNGTKAEEDTRFTGKTRERFNLLKADPDDLFVPVRSLKRYSDVMRKGVELVYIDGDVYTNIPIGS